MIVWSGRGFLSIVVLFATLFLCVAILPKENDDIGFVITAFVTGIFSWVYGKKWNTQNERIVIDEKTGERLLIKNNHTLFWIPMQYWGVIFSILGVIILFQNSLLFGIISSLILMTFMIVPFFNKKTAKSPLEVVATKTNLVANNESKETEEEAISEGELIRIRKEKEDPSRFMP
jgi:hypothetical protein